MVPRELCEAWIERTAAAAPGASGQAFLAALRSYLRDWLGEPTPLTFPGTRVAAVVGPTGVGKTTTLAKLAARASLVGGRRVALVTTDDQRIGSTTALRAYAEALGMPMTTTSAAGGLARALATYSEADLVLVDTAGVPVGDRAALDALGTRLERAGEPITRHLCLAGSTRQQELDRILQAYAVAAPDAVLVTKLDEAIAIGSVFSALADHRLSFSFLANGQQVPDDIAPATADRLIDHVLGGVPT
jgi:flagellar biosynthesis protein FlhF